MTEAVAAAIDEETPAQNTGIVNLAPILDYLKLDGPHVDTGYKFLSDKMNIDPDKMRYIVARLSMAELRALRSHVDTYLREQTDYWTEMLNKMDNVHSARVTFWRRAAQLHYNVGRYVTVKQEAGANNPGALPELHITVQSCNNACPNTHESKEGASKAIEVADLIQGAVNADCSYADTLGKIISDAIDELYVKAGRCHHEYLDKHAEQVKKERSADLPF